MVFNQKVEIQPSIVFPIQNVKITEFLMLLQTHVLIKKHQFVLFADLAILDFAINLELYDL